MHGRVDDRVDQRVDGQEEHRGDAVGFRGQDLTAEADEGHEADGQEAHGVGRYDDGDAAPQRLSLVRLAVVVRWLAAAPRVDDDERRAAVYGDVSGRDEQDRAEVEDDDEERVGEVGAARVRVQVGEADAAVAVEAE